MVRGDALAVIRHLPAHYADAVIADPPYSSGGQFRGDRTADPITKYVSSDSAAGRELATFAGDSRDQRGYLAWSALWMGEALRVTAPGGALLVFCDWRQLPITTDAVQAAGWTWRGITVWHKPVNRPQSGRFSAACEYVVWATAGHRPLTYPTDALQGWISASTPSTATRGHPTEKPLAVMRHLAQIAPAGGLVLDPFAGCGTGPVAALIEGRRVLAVEITDYYARATADRVRAVEVGGTDQQPTLFAPKGTDDAAGDIR